MGNTFGQLFRVTTWGESHGAAIGAVVDGCPPRLPLSRGRHPAGPRPPRARARALLTTPAQGVRHRPDPERRLRGPDARHADQRSRSRTRTCAPATTARCRRSTGRATPTTPTTRSTASATGAAAAGRAPARRPARVAAGAIARKLLRSALGRRDRRLGVARSARLVAECDVERVTREDVERTPIRCPDPGDGRADDRGRRGGAQGRRTRSAASSTCAVRGCPPGWGEPVFDRLEADLAKAMMSLPASKGFEIGSGFAGTELTGLEHNDEFYMDGDRVRTRTNRERRRPGRHHQRRDDLLPRRLQADRDDHARAAHRRRRTTRTRRITGRGRHDPCVLPRAVPMVEAMAALVLADHALRQEAIRAGAPAHRD